MTRITLLLFAVVFLGCTQTLTTVDKPANVVVVTHVGGGPDPCNGIFENGIDRPLPGATIILDNQSGMTGIYGTKSFQVSPTTTHTLSVVFPSTYRGATLAPCPPDEIEIAPDDFKGGNTKWFNHVFWAQRTGIATSTPEVMLNARIAGD